MPQKSLGSTGAMSVADAKVPQPDLQSLTRLFYPAPADLGAFVPVHAADMPPDYRRLLDHHGHMTETVESYHESPVDVVVLQKLVTRSHYARKILLTSRRDDRVVQFGIMRVALDAIDADVRDEIESETVPLGRILIAHGVMRQVRLSCLYRVLPGAELQALLRSRDGQETFGRTAMIQLRRRPAVELLEIVAPV